MYDTLRIEREEHLTWLTLDRPDHLNAMNGTLIREVRDFFWNLGDDRDTRVVVMRGAGRVFCAGGDINDMPRRRDANEYRATRLAIEQSIARAVRQLEKPLIAQIHGAAIGGGCVLAALCDLRIAAVGTKFGLPEVKFGTTASLGGIYMLTRIIGLGRAFELLYLGDSFAAERALEIGLINRLVPADALVRETAAIARAIAENFSAELALTRTAILSGLDLDFQSAARLETEAAMQAHLGGDIEAGFARARETLLRKGGTK